MKRRTFLKKSGLLCSSSIFAPMILKAETLGLAGATSPNSRINIGLIGCGKIMDGHRGYFRSRDRSQVVAVCDVNQVFREEYKENIEEATGSPCDSYEHYEELLQRPDIDAVVIGTPDHWHAAISIAAMRAGKDVYVEKPMTLTVGESLAMVEAQKRYARVLQVGSQQRSDWRFRKAAEMVRNGWIGELKEIYALLGSFPAPYLREPEPVPEGFNYDKWLGPTPYEEYFEDRTRGDYGGGWRRFWEYGSRKQGDWGAHHFDIIQWALGMDHSGATLFVPKGYEGSPYQYHEYANGLRVYRDHKEMNGFMIRFIGKKGEILVSRDDLASDPPDLARRPLSPSDKRLYHSNDHRGNWLDCIHSREKPICDVGVGHRSGTICLLSGIAERINRPISWDPVKQIIPDDPAASRLLDRPRRAGYELPA
ncbi:MAG: Gfo/Idh/MocA family protein [Puniceicoccaceae bacterium]